MLKDNGWEEILKGSKGLPSKTAKIRPRRKENA